VGDAGPGHAIEAASSRDGQARPRQIEPPRAAVSLQEPEIAARAASTVEEPQPRSVAGRLLQQRRDELPESTEPEMVAFGARRRFEQSIHACIVLCGLQRCDVK